MKQSKPTSLKLFVLATVITVIIFLIATFSPGYGQNLAFVLVLVFVLTGVGTYSGLKYKTDESKLRNRNRVGLVGNLVIFLFILGIMIYALTLID